MGTEKSKKAEPEASEALTLERWAYLIAAVQEELPARETETFTELLADLRQAQVFQQRLEKMAVDAGHDRRAAGWPRDVALAHRDLDRLLAESWRHPAEVLAPEDWMEPDYHTLILICAARRSRGEGDVEQLTEVEEKLRAAAAGRAA